ncbi:DUF4402 domain-containing protein [Caulobacter sp. KR2-114]|uniref:DUF4402 domain-containing protein n=1 Tax=Caulobacter sp. KR2-114 TaxID=3400912 RepID=UPI003C034F67
MKKYLGAVAAAALVLGGASSAMAAQASASVTASAVVVTPITESVTTNMNFGKLVMNASNSTGTVVLTQSNTRSAGGTGVDLVGGTGGVSAVVHFVGDTTNGGNSAYNVTIDSTATLNDPGNVHSMSVTSIGTTDQTTGLVGAQDVHIGATLNAAANQAAGSYQGSFNVTAAYQ